MLVIALGLLAIGLGIFFEYGNFHYYMSPIPTTFSYTVVSLTLRKLLGVKEDLGPIVHISIFISLSLVLFTFPLLAFFIMLLYMLPRIVRRLGSGLKGSFSSSDWSIKPNGPLEYIFSFGSSSLTLLPINRR